MSSRFRIGGTQCLLCGEGFWFDVHRHPFQIIIPDCFTGNTDYYYVRWRGYFSRIFDVDFKGPFSTYMFQTVGILCPKCYPSTSKEISIRFTFRQDRYYVNIIVTSDDGEGLCRTSFAVDVEKLSDNAKIDLLRKAIGELDLRENPDSRSHNWVLPDCSDINPAKRD